MNFGDWMKTVRFNILRALLQGLLLAVINSGVAADSNIDHCCGTLAQLAIDQQEQSLARELFHRDQNPGKDDKSYAGNLQILSEQPFGVPGGISTTNHRGEASLCEDQRSQSDGRGRDQGVP
ncbi:unnamed protein product [Taenia asiatica]|uniref:DUF5726 domain-containing protein n=1 Tax=Taenia asiatica TaxID=60517 RepID=A0A0R3W1Z8_TAEAS|nr:unnamed protein product [Taenia asiatica]